MESVLLGKRKERSEQREGLRKDAKLRLSPIKCPVCEVTLRPESMAQHYQQELAKLENLQPAHSRREPRASTSTATSEEGTEGKADLLRHARETLDSIQRRQFLFEHRSHDQSTSAAAVESASGGGGGVCPVCSVQLPSDQSRTDHIDACLEEQERRLQSMADGVDSGSVSSGSEEEYEEYTWCNMTRIRTTTLLSPETRASMFNAAVISRPSDTSFEETVDVEEDATAVYGPPQFSEDDVVTVSENEEGTAVGGDDGAESKQFHQSDSTSSHDVEKKPISLLPQCLICMDHYESPLVSIQCWHVYCERCWLKALKAQKLCPKCKTITCPGDLRRIFL